MSTKAKYYVEAERGRGGKVVAYGIYDNVGGMVSEHERFEVSADRPEEVALRLANQCRDELNSVSA